MSTRLLRHRIPRAINRSGSIATSRLSIAGLFLLLIAGNAGIEAQEPVDAAAAAIQHLQEERTLPTAIRLGVVSLDREVVPIEEIAALALWNSEVARAAEVDADLTPTFARPRCTAVEYAGESRRHCVWNAPGDPVEVGLPVPLEGERGFHFEILARSLPSSPTRAGAMYGKTVQVAVRPHAAGGWIVDVKEVMNLHFSVGTGR